MKKSCKNLFNNIKYLPANYLNLLKKKTLALLSDFWFSDLANGALLRWTRQKPCLFFTILIGYADSKNFFERYEKSLDKLSSLCHKGLAGDIGEPRRTKFSNLVSDKLPFIA